MESRTLVISNTLGMHARAAAKFVRAASAFRAKISVSRDERTMDGKSILGLLLLAASRGTSILVTAEGEDEREAIETLSRLVLDKFDEDA
ncbi:MAG: HPr family phosphocarrier protein [Vicinamibacterales bacterium]